MRWVARIVLASAMVMAAGMGQAQQAPQKLALVIGNADYNLDGSITTPNQVSDSAGFPRDLQKPRNDAADVAAALTRLHFDVITKIDATRPAMIAALAQFGQKVSLAGRNAVVVVYYSGHAMQVDGLNLLIPAGARLPSGYDFRRLPAATSQEILASETVSLPLVFNQLNDPDEGVNVVILDSCRNNWWDSQVNGAGRGPVAGGMSNRITTARGAAERHTDLGATLIAFSTQPGNVADDGAPGARNSPYTTALKARLEQPGVTVLELFNTVARDVQTATRDWSIPQRPWNNGVTLPDVCLAGCTRPTAAITAPPPLQQTPPTVASQTPATVPASGVRSPPPPVAAAPATSARPPGSTFHECAECPEMIVLPAGSFVMGSPVGVGETDEQPQATLTVPSFAVSATEITTAQWSACVTGGVCRAIVYPAAATERNIPPEALPMTMVTWDDARTYVRWLNSRIGINKYRLLSEAQWEYAARSNSEGSYPWGGDAIAEHANVTGQGGKDRWEARAPVGSFAPNAFALKDMHGNVAEWVQDCYFTGLQRTSSNAYEVQNAGFCPQRVVRGGSFQSTPQKIRSAARDRLGGGSASATIGFRIARTL